MPPSHCRPRQRAGKLKHRITNDTQIPDPPVCPRLGRPRRAQTPLTGALTATRDCPATVSIKQRDPAGGVRLEPGRAYRLLGKNKPQQATHYQVVIDGTIPAERWVEVGCGTIPGEPTADAKAPSDAPASDIPRGMAPGARPIRPRFRLRRKPSPNPSPAPSSSP